MAYLTSCYRYEKPQAGRLREFHQFGAECFGAAEPQADAELVALARTVLQTLGVTGVSLHLNSIGCPTCRAEYHKALKAYFSARREELCQTCQERLERNPMRILDCKSPVCREIAAGAPVMLDYLCADCAAHFGEVRACLTAAEIPFELDTGIVRGLDYYTRTVFEFVSDALGAQAVVCGGGRYDGLVEELGGPHLPSLGFALVTRLREGGVAAECDLTGRGLKAQMKYADKLGARYTVVVGDNELASQRAVLKDMADGKTEEIALDDSLYTTLYNKSLDRQLAGMADLFDSVREE